MGRKLVLFVLFIFCIAVFAACGSPPNNGETPGDGTTAPPDTSGNGGADPLTKALSAEKLTADDELTRLFLDYYDEHSFELRFLPSFEDRQSLSWDELSFYVFNLAADTDSEYEGYITKEAFAETVSRYFGDLSYEHGDSEYLTFNGSRYLPIGWDTMGTEYFRLTDISKESDDIFRASFDGISFHDLDFTDSYDEVSPNMKAVMDELGVKAAPENAKTLRDAIARMLLKNDYAEKFEIDDRLTITFMRSEREDSLFIYTSCERADEVEGPVTSQS